MLSRPQRPKLDEYADYLFIVLHFPRYDKAAGRLGVTEVDVFVGPDFLVTCPNQPLPTVTRIFERCQHDETYRQELFSKGSGFLLYTLLSEIAKYSEAL